jgi:hypothetical protein
MSREWISISERKPEENQKIYYFGDHLGMFRGEYFYDETSKGNPHKFYSEHGIVDADDISHWMPYDHGLKDIIPFPPDYKTDRCSETISMISIPEEHRQLVFSYEIMGEINE